MIRDSRLRMDLGLLQALEREKVLEVLQRDKMLRKIEEDRIRRMKYELQELRRKGAKNFAREYGERTCARCQRPLGKFWNSGAVCRGCSHRICCKCRVCTGGVTWKCTVCYAYREMKIRSGEWFLEERAKKFPVTMGKYETIGEKILKTYNEINHISVVPPTPPPNLESQFLSRSTELRKSKPLTNSVEDIIVSTIGSQNKNFSLSQNDVRGDLLSVNNRKDPRFIYSTQKSLSDTNISKSVSMPFQLFQRPSLSNLFKRTKDSDQEGSSTGAEEETSFSSECSGGRMGSFSSINTDFEGNNVTGELSLAFYYNSSDSFLEITIGACRNLCSENIRKRKCHPYVKLYVLPEKTPKMKTSVKKNTTNPEYNEVLKYTVKRHQLVGKRLQASVWHSRALKRKLFLGEVLIPLDGCRFEGKGSQGFHWFPLCPKSGNPEVQGFEQDTRV